MQSSTEIQESYWKTYYGNNKDRVIKISMKSQKKAVDEKRFYCEEHNKEYYSNYRLRKHLNGYAHTRKYISYKCKVCRYNTKIKFK